jgi:hypothetical protein
MTITRLHQAGLEVDAQNSLALEFDAVTGTGITVVTTQPKTGQYHISLAAPGTGTTGHNVTKMLHPTNVYTQLRGGYHLKVTKDSWKSGSTTTSPVLFAFYQDSTEVAKVVIGTDGKWTAHVGGTQVAAARAGREDVYLHFGFQFKLHATTGIFKVFEDGLTMVDYAGDTIGATGATGINKILIGTTAAAQKLTASIDDFYIDNTAGESVFGPVPDLRFAFLLPNGNGSFSQFIGSDGDSTDNYLLVDERPHDGDTTYVKAVAANTKDLYQMNDITLEPGWTINAVIPCTIARKVNAADDTKIRLAMRSGVVDWQSSERDLLPYYTLLFERLETDPDGVAPWDETSVNGMEIGIVSAGTF